MSQSKLKNIGNSAFKSNDLKAITIPASVSRIGRSAFAGNNFTDVTFNQPSQLLSIEAGAFNSWVLNEFTLPEPLIEGYNYHGWVDINNLIHSTY